jgi:hypothetical protein
VETLVAAGDPAADLGDQTKWCVGIAVDPKGGQIYWTQKGSDNAHQQGPLGHLARVVSLCRIGNPPGERRMGDAQGCGAPRRHARGRP